MLVSIIEQMFWSCQEDNVTKFFRVPDHARTLYGGGDGRLEVCHFVTTY